MKTKDMSASTSIEIIITTSLPSPINAEDLRDNADRFHAARIVGRKTEAVTPELKAAILQYAEPGDFDGNQAVVMLDVSAHTRAWREKYGDDIDGNRGQMQTVYGDLKIYEVTGPRPVPHELTAALEGFLTHEDFDWDRCH